MGIVAEKGWPPWHQSVWLTAAPIEVLGTWGGQQLWPAGTGPWTEVQISVYHHTRLWRDPHHRWVGWLFTDSEGCGWYCFGQCLWPLTSVSGTEKTLVRGRRIQLSPLTTGTSQAVMLWILISMPLSQSWPLWEPLSFQPRNRLLDRKGWQKVQAGGSGCRWASQIGCGPRAEHLPTAPTLANPRIVVGCGGAWGWGNSSLWVQESQQFSPRVPGCILSLIWVPKAQPHKYPDCRGWGSPSEGSYSPCPPPYTNFGYKGNII